MQRALAIVSTIAVVLVSSACQKSKPIPPKAAPAGPAWSLNYQSNCASGDTDENCLGKYGFTVTADGTYKVGPAPNGQVLKGSLTNDEIKAMDTALSGAVATARLDLDHSDNCESRPTESEETVTFVKKGKTKVLYHSTTDNTCYQTASLDEADSLRNAIEALAEKYYAIPFPDACLDAANQVAALYPAVTACTKNSDCAYLDPSYQPIAATDSQYVTTDSCSKIPNLAVANAALLSANLGKIQTALNNAQTVCGDQIARNNCQGVTGFQSDAAPPVCEKNVCKVNPAATGLR